LYNDQENAVSSGGTPAANEGHKENKDSNDNHSSGDALGGETWDGLVNGITSEGNQENASELEKKRTRREREGYWSKEKKKKKKKKKKKEKEKEKRKRKRKKKKKKKKEKEKEKKKRKEKKGYHEENVQSQGDEPHHIGSKRKLHGLKTGW